jgi:hypothetical protein
MANNYYNFKNIVEDFKLLQRKHKQLNSFGVGDIRQLLFLTQQRLEEDNDDDNSPIYPLIYLVPQAAQREEALITYNFNVIICDIENTKNYDIEVDLWSDTLQIAEDVLAQFKYSVNAQQGNFVSRYYINLPTQIIPFSEMYEDLLVGWNLQLQIVVDSPLNRCIAPYKDFD